jgi:hypothetical protein
MRRDDIREELRFARFIEDAWELALDVAAGDFIQKPLRSARHERQNSWCKECNLALAVLAIDAVFLTEAFVEGGLEGVEIRGLRPRIELDEEGIA